MAQTAPWKQPFHQTRYLLAKKYLRFFPKLRIIGVTGSYGKTSTARAISSVLSQKYKTLMTDLNLDTIYNLPITLLKLRPTHQKLVLELGVDHLGEMNSYLKLVKPSIAVLTGITPVHSDPDLLGSLEGIIREKGKLLKSLPKDGVAILNRDDLHVRQMAHKTKAKVIWYGLDKKGVNYLADDIKVNFNGTSFNLHIDESIHRRKFRLTTGLVGRHFVHPCLAAVIIGQLEGLTIPEIKRGLKILKPLEGRVSIGKGPKGSILINDALRANPPSTIAGLRVLKDLSTKGRRIAVLGEMGELGSYAQKKHKEVGEEVAKRKIDYLVGVGPLSKYTAKSAHKAGMKKENIFWVSDVKGAAEILVNILKKGDLLYLKGSLLRHMERILLLLRGQKVGCSAVDCHFYHHCPVCPYLKTGYDPRKN